MKTKAAVVLVAALMIGAGKAPDTKKELAKLAGTWSVSELTYNGEESNKLKFNIVFKGDEGVVEGNDEVKKEYAKIKIKIDAASKPKTIDFIIAEGIQKDAVIEGIYEIKDDTLKICAKVFGKDRPGEFTSPEGSSTVLLVLKRSNP